MKSIEDRLAVFASPVFLLAVLLLLLNDALLKFAFPGLITGKLSDFAGLFAFGYVVAAFTPMSRRRTALAVVAVGFVWWKSSLSTPFISTWNSATGFHWARVQDFTDLIALSSVLFVLPTLHRAELRAKTSARTLAVSIPGLTLAVLAFSATSEGSTTAKFDKNERVYYLPISEADVLNGTHGAYGDPYPNAYGDSTMRGVRLRLEWDSTPAKCYGGAIVSVRARGELTRVALREVSVIDHCGRGQNKEWLAERFEQLVIEPLLPPKRDSLPFALSDSALMPRRPRTLAPKSPPR